MVLDGRQSPAGSLHSEEGSPLISSHVYADCMSSPPLAKTICLISSTGSYLNLIHTYPE